MTNNKSNPDTQENIKTSESSTKRGFQRLTEKFVSNNTGFASYSRSSAGNVIFDKNILSMGVGDQELTRTGQQLRLEPMFVSTQRSWPEPLRLDVYHADEESIIEQLLVSHGTPFGKATVKRKLFMPLVCNSLSTLNVTGFNPNHSFIDLVHSFKIDEENGIVKQVTTTSKDLKRFKLFAVTGQDWDASGGDRGDGFDSNLSLRNIKNVSNMITEAVAGNKMSVDKLDSKISKGAAAASYLHDPYTDTFVYDIEKVRENLANFYATSREKINFLLAHRSLIPSAITSMIELGTFMRILLDTYKGNLLNVQTFSKKLGIVDSTIRKILNGNKATKDNFSNAMSRLSALVDKLPYNEVVYAEYEENKKAWIAEGLDVYSATTILHAPVFEIVSANGDSDLTWHDVKAHASVSRWSVPFGSMLKHFLSKFNFSDRKYPVTTLTEGDTSVAVHKKDGHSFLNLSYARMTEASSQILANLMYNPDVQNAMQDYLYNLGAFISELHNAKAFEGTSFKFSNISWNNNFKTMNEHESPLSVNKPALTSLEVESFRHYPLISNKDDQGAPKVLEYATTDSKICPIDTDIKAFVVKKPQDTQLELLGVVLENPVIFRFNDEFSYFGFNTMPFAKSQEVLFTSGVNSRLYATPIQFEWSTVQNSIVQSLNADQKVSTAANVMATGYLAVTNCAIFDKADAEWGRYSSMLFKNFPDLPLLHSGFSESGGKTVKTHLGVSQFAYYADWVISKGSGAKWVGLAPIKPVPAKEKSYFKYE